MSEKALRSVVADQSQRIQLLLAALKKSESQRKLAVDLLRVFTKESGRIGEYGGTIKFFETVKEIVETP